MSSRRLSEEFKRFERRVQDTRIMSLIHLSESIKAEAKNLGFFACGIAQAAPVDPDIAAAFGEWLAQGGNADMAYMANHADKRMDPRLLVPGVKSIVSVALSYVPARRIPNGELQLAAYAYGQDYHDIMKDKLRRLAAFAERLLDANGSTAQPESPHGNTKTADSIGKQPNGKEKAPRFRCFCDTAPVLERYWAVQAGIGWIGRNRQLIIPHAGSMFFLGELFLDVDMEYDKPMESRCGHCRACLDACPTGALREGRSDFDAFSCLSYQTIENRGQLSAAAVSSMGDFIYGCDRCQQACPWNRFAQPASEPELKPSDELLSMTRDDWRALSVDDYRRIFKGSAVKRAKYEGLMRNINAALDHEYGGGED